MNEIRLFLDLSSEADNLYIETGHSGRAMYQIFGYGALDEDEHPDAFTNAPQIIDLEAGTQNVLGNLTNVDSNDLLATNVTLFGPDEVCTYEFENKELDALGKVGEDLYEIPHKEQNAIGTREVANIFAKEFYSLEYDDTQDDLPLSTNRLLVFLYEEKARVYRSGILENEDYRNFFTEVNQFMMDYEVEFEQSEGTELVLGTLYILREYLHQDWEEIYELLKRS